MNSIGSTSKFFQTNCFFSSHNGVNEFSSTDMNQSPSFPQVICSNDNIYSDNPGRNSSISNKNSHPDILSEKKYNTQLNQEPVSNFPGSQMKQVSVSGENIKNIVEGCMEEENNDMCEVCYEDLLPGEVIYYCLCGKFYHPNCLIFFLSKNRLSNSKDCSQCQSAYSVASYKLSSSCGRSSLNCEGVCSKCPQDMTHSMENSTCEHSNAISMDTNINNLGNYKEMCGLAFQMCPETIAEMIGKSNEKGSLSSNGKEEVGRIALSPINFQNTPYSGKSKKQSSSTRKVEEYILLQNTHTTPNNKHIDQLGNSDNHRSDYLNEQSPDTSLHGVRQHLNFCSPNNPYGNANSEANVNANVNVNVNVNGINPGGGFQQNMSLISLFENSMNGTNVVLNSTKGQVSFRNLIFDDTPVEDNTGSGYPDRDETNNDDKENSPPLPRESSKFSYTESDLKITHNSLLDVNLEAGISHIISDTNKIIEVPITIDTKLKDMSCNLMPYSKDIIVIFNTRSINSEAIFTVFKTLSEKITDNDRIFSNLFKLGKWITKEELNIILNPNSFESFLQETAILDYSEIAKLILFCIDLSFEFHSNIFSLILINDIDEIPEEVDYTEEIRTVVNKLKENKVNLIKNFTINSVVIDVKSEDGRTVPQFKFISFLYDLSMLCMGYFFAPKDLNELYKSMYLLFTMFDQFSLLNLKLVLKGNKDPSVYIETLNYPAIKKQHNHFEIFLGSLLKKERKFMNLTAVVILNTANVSLNLPLLEVSVEYLTLKNLIGKDSNSTNLSNFFSSTSNNLIRCRTPFYQISIPVISTFKEVLISDAVFFRNICAKTAERIKECMEIVKFLRLDEALVRLYEAKRTFECSFKSQTGLLKSFKILSDFAMTRNMSMSALMNLNSNMSNCSFLNYNNTNYSLGFDDSLMYSNTRNLDGANISKIFNFALMILLDLNSIIENLKNRNMNNYCDMLTISNSLMFYRSVNLSDERFVDDNIE